MCYISNDDMPKQKLYIKHLQSFAVEKALRSNHAGGNLVEQAIIHNTNYSSCNYNSSGTEQLLKKRRIKKKKKITGVKFSPEVKHTCIVYDMHASEQSYSC